MKNIEFVVNENVLKITVDLSRDFGPSKSGKTKIVASTEGNVRLDGEYSDIRIGLNVFKVEG